MSNIQVFPVVWPHKTDQTFVHLYVRVVNGQAKVIAHPDLPGFIPNSELPQVIRELVGDAGLEIAADRNRPGIMLFYDPALPLDDVKFAFDTLLTWSGHSEPRKTGETL